MICLRWVVCSHCNAAFTQSDKSAELAQGPGQPLTLSFSSLYYSYSVCWASALRHSHSRIWRGKAHRKVIISRRYSVRIYTCTIWCWLRIADICDHAFFRCRIFVHVALSKIKSKQGVETALGLSTHVFTNIFVGILYFSTFYLWSYLFSLHVSERKYIWS